MSASSHPPIFVSVTKLEYRERNVSDDNVACYLFLNSRPISVFKTSDHHHFVSISASSPEDILQFIFQTDEQNEAIGCVSFMMKHLLNSSSTQCSQWVTLFDDPEDDIFDGVLGENDEEWPRALISFDLHEDRSLNISKEIQAKDKEKVEDTLTLSPLKEATQETLMDFSGDLASQRSHYPPVFNDQNNNTSFKLHIVPTTMDTKSEKGGNPDADIFPDFPSSENPLPMEKEILYQSSGGTQEVVSQPNPIKHSTFKEKPATEGKKRKETFGDSFEFTNEDNQKKMAEMKMIIENLEREKIMLKKNEQTYHLKLNHSRIEVEKLKFNKENYENTIKELQDQLAQEKALRILLEKEKGHKKHAEAMTERKDSQKQINERDSPNQLKCYEPLFSHKERKYKEEIESLHKQIMQLKNEYKLAKTQVECDESIIQNLQKEIYALREKESHPQNTPDDKDREHYDKLIDICSTHLFNNQQQVSKFDSLEEFITKVQSELIAKNQETLELKNINEGLQIKLSVCDNKILADSLWNQINSFKQQVSTLEKERDKLKAELSKTNENYIRLTNKYTELTDVLAELQKPVQRLLKSGSKASVSPTPNRSRVTPQQQTSRFDRNDETELKLMEFISQYKLQPSLFQRVDKNVYMYNRRQVFLRLVKGKLVVKIGVGYKPLQEFLRIEEPYERTPPRQQRVNTDYDDKSFDGRYSKHNKSEILNVLATEPSYRDYSMDHPTSGSFIRENLRDLSYREHDRDDEKNRKKSSRVKDKFQEITSSKSVERRISFNLYQPQSSRNSGRLTPI